MALTALGSVAERAGKMATDSVARLAGLGTAQVF